MMYVALLSLVHKLNTANTCAGSPPSGMAMLDSIHSVLPLEHREVWIWNPHLGCPFQRLRTTSLHGMVCRGHLSCLNMLHKMLDPAVLPTSDQGNLQHALEVCYLDRDHRYCRVLPRLHFLAHILMLSDGGLLEVIRSVLQGKFPLHPIEIHKRPVRRHERRQ